MQECLFFIYYITHCHDLGNHAHYLCRTSLYRPHLGQVLSNRFQSTGVVVIRKIEWLNYYLDPFKKSSFINY